MLTYAHVCSRVPQPRKQYTYEKSADGSVAKHNLKVYSHCTNTIV
jgi:hypothetical protein